MNNRQLTLGKDRRFSIGGRNRVQSERKVGGREEENSRERD